jgi:hypothetical protein
MKPPGWAAPVVVLVAFTLTGAATAARADEDPVFVEPGLDDPPDEVDSALELGPWSREEALDEGLRARIRALRASEPRSPWLPRIELVLRAEPSSGWQLDREAGRVDRLAPGRSAAVRWMIYASWGGR